MADKTIIVKIEAVVNNLASKLRSVTGDIDKFARSNQFLSKTFGLMNNAQKATVSSMKAMTDGQKAVARGFLDLDKKTQTVASRYAKLDASHKKIGASYKQLSNDIINGSVKASSAQQRIINQWKALPASVKGAITSFHNQNNATQKVISGFAGLDTSLRKSITHFASFPATLQRAKSHVLGLSGAMSTMTKASAASGKAQADAGNKYQQAFSKIGKAIFNFNNLARTATSASRAIGTSMIFAGGAFRDLGVGINVTASLLQTVIPMFGNLVGVLGSLGPIGIAVGGALAIIVAQLASIVAVGAAAGLTLFKIAEAGFEFNKILESTQISIATLITQFKDLYTVGNVQIGAFKEMTDAQIKSASAVQLDEYAKGQAVSINEKLTASMGLAQNAFNLLTAEAAQSPFTTTELASGFQAVVASLGQYNVSTEQAAKLTVTLGRVASVAGVSASNLASQFTLFLTGAGRITSPLSRFASAVGLTKQKMEELRSEFKKAKDDPEKTAAIMSVLTTRLAAFDIAGIRVAQSWAGIMSNMTESFELFAGAVTKGMFERIRNTFIEVIPALNDSGQRMVEVLDSKGKVLETKVEGTGTKIAGTVERLKTKTVGIMSQIFEFDETGAFKNAGQDISQLFTEPFRGAIATLKDLFSTVGEDVRSVLQFIVNKLIEWAKWAGQNKNTILDTYETFKNLLISAGRLVVSIARLVGISDDIGENFENLNKILTVSLGLANKLANALSGLEYIKQSIELDQLEAERATNAYDEYLPEFLGGGDQTEKNKKLDEQIARKKRILAKMEKDASDEADRQARNEDPIGYAKSRIDSVRKKGFTGSEANPSYLPEYFKNMSDEEIYRFLKDADLKDKTYVPPSPSVTEKPKASGEDDEEGKQKKADKIRYRVIQALFRERKEYAEAEVELEKTKFENIFKLATQAVESQKEILDQQLADNEISYEDFYSKIETLRQTSLKNSLNSIQTEEAELRKKHTFELNSLEQERYNIEATYQASDRSASDLAEKERDLAALAIKRQIENKNFETERLKLANQRIATEREFEQERLKNLYAQRKAINELFQTMRDIRSQLDQTLDDPTDAGAILRAQDAISRKYAEQLVYLEAQKNLTAEGERQRQEAIQALTRLNVLERARVETNAILANFKNQEEDATRALTILEERRNYGLITEAQYQKLSNEFRLENVKLLRQELVTLQERLSLAVDNKDILEERNIRREMLDVQIRLNKEQVVTEKVLLRMANERREAFRDFFGSVLDGTKTIGDAFMDLGKRITKMYQDALLDRLFKGKFFTKLFGNENQTEGSPTGWFSKGDRAAGVDEDTSAALQSKADAFDTGLTRVVLTSEEYAEELKRATDALREYYNKKLEETPVQNAQIDAAVATINAREVKTTPADFGGVADPTATRPRIVADTGGKGGTTATAAGLVPHLSSRAKNIFGDLAKKYQITPESILAVIGTESLGGKSTAVGRAGGDLFGGLFQLSKNLGDWKRLGFKSWEQFLGSGDVKQADAYKRWLSLTNAGSLLSGIDKLSPAQQAAALQFHQFRPGMSLEEMMGVGRKSQPIVRNQARALGFDKKGTVNFDSLTKYYEGMGLGGTPNFNPNVTGIGKTGGITSVSIDNVAPNAAQQQADAVQQQVQEATKAVADTGEGDTTLTQIAGKLDAIATAVGEGGLGVIRTAVGSIDTKMGGGLSVELTTFLTNLSTMLTSAVTTPIVTAIQSANFMSGFGTASNIDEAATGGYISGPGGPIDDKVPAWLSNGEYVIRAAAVKALGLDNLHMLNYADKLADGGQPKIKGGLFGYMLYRLRQIRGQRNLSPRSVGKDLRPFHPIDIGSGDDMLGGSIELPKFGWGGFVNIFKGIGKFMGTDMGKLALTTVIPLLTKQFFGDKAANAMAMAMPFVFAGLIDPKKMKEKKAEKAIETSQHLTSQYFDEEMMPGMGRAGLFRRAKGGLVFKKGLPAFGGGGFWSGFGSAFGGKTPDGGFKSGSSGSIGAAVGAGAINAAISIGMALLGRWQAKKAWKRQLEEYKKNRTPDPYGMNPETLTFYKKPIITGSRNWLSRGGPITSNMMLKNMPRFAMGGLNDMDIEDIIQDVNIGDSPINVTNNVNISTPDVHSFRNSRGQLERDLARVTQRGLKRRAPKY